MKNEARIGEEDVGSERWAWREEQRGMGDSRGQWTEDGPGDRDKRGGQRGGLGEQRD